MSKQEIIDDDNHKCYCEKKICGCKSDEYYCCVSMNEWFEAFITYPNGYKSTNDDCVCTCICCPFKLPILLLFLPCTFYNVCRNKCNNTNKKNYLC